LGAWATRHWSDSKATGAPSRATRSLRDQRHQCTDGVADLKVPPVPYLKSPGAGGGPRHCISSISQNTLRHLGDHRPLSLSFPRPSVSTTRLPYILPPYFQSPFSSACATRRLSRPRPRALPHSHPSIDKLSLGIKPTRAHSHLAWLFHPNAPRRLEEPPCCIPYDICFPGRRPPCGMASVDAAAPVNFGDGAKVATLPRGTDP
jgi:hypothetical protein